MQCIAAAYVTPAPTVGCGPAGLHQLVVLVGSSFVEAVRTCAPAEDQHDQRDHDQVERERHQPGVAGHAEYRHLPHRGEVLRGGDPGSAHHPYEPAREQAPAVKPAG